MRNKEVDFVAKKNDKILYVQVAYLLTDHTTVEREYSVLEAIPDNYEKVVVSLDEFELPNRNGIIHRLAWDFNGFIWSLWTTGTAHRLASAPFFLILTWNINTLILNLNLNLNL